MCSNLPKIVSSEPLFAKSNVLLNNFTNLLRLVMILKFSLIKIYCWLLRIVFISYLYLDLK